MSYSLQEEAISDQLNCWLCRLGVEGKKNIEAITLPCVTVPIIGMSEYHLDSDPVSKTVRRSYTNMKYSKYKKCKKCHTLSVLSVTVLIRRRLVTQWPSTDCGKDFTLWHFVALDSMTTE